MEEKESSIDGEVRKGPWTAEEDMILINYVAIHGEGLWNSVAVSAGLKRTGKSCRLRWLNYLRPDLRRGNITPEENKIIKDLHAKWGNRWSKIAKQLPGRTDNEIKNYWRTRVQKSIKHEQKLDDPLNYREESTSNQASTNEIGEINKEMYYSPQLFLQGNFEEIQNPNLIEDPNESIWNMEDLSLCNYLLGTINNS